MSQLPHTVLGLDGCRSGWVAVQWDQKTEASYKLITDDAELEAAIDEADLALIDIPIGLEEENYTRQADQQLRDVLGKEYASSVFNAPIRPAAEAPNYAAASMISFDFTEKKISMQSWNITPKIIQIDRLLTRREDLRPKLVESHPELIFKILNGGNVVEQKKSTNLGLKHRLNLVREFIPNAKDLYREIKESENSKDVKENDLLDAMALAIAAHLAQKNGLKKIPDPAPVDAKGLEMAIHFADR